MTDCIPRALAMLTELLAAFVPKPRVNLNCVGGEFLNHAAIGI